MNRYAQLFAGLAEKCEGAFGAFVMLGDPDLETCASILDRLVRAGADMLEVGIPFSDPVADGPVIQAAANRALRAGVTPAGCFALLQRFRARHPQVPIGILTYANLVMARGRDDFYRRTAEAGVDSVLVADVPAIEAMPFVSTARAYGVAPVLIAAPNTPAARLCDVARLGRGYTYCVARAGVTGADEAAQGDHRAMFEALAAAGAPPPVLGFGISTPGQVAAALATGAAGVICGSAIVDRIANDAGQLETFVRLMKASSRRALIVGA